MSQVPLSSLQVAAINQLETVVKGRSITLMNPQIKDPLFYRVINPQPYISFHTLKQFTQQNPESPISDQQHIVQNLENFSEGYAQILQHNQQCRCLWGSALHGSRAQGKSNIGLDSLSDERKVVIEVWQQCKYGIGNRQELLQFLALRAKDIFEWKDHSEIYKHLKQLILPQIPQYYQLLTPIGAKDYYQLYQSTIEQLSVIINTCKQYLKRSITLQQLRSQAKEWIRTDSVLFNRKAIDDLIKHVLAFSQAQFAELKKTAEEIYNLRKKIIRSIARMNFIVRNADQEIEIIAQALSKIEDQVLNVVSSNQSKNFIRGMTIKQSRVGYGTTLLNNHRSISANLIQSTDAFKTDINTQVATVQQQFNLIFTYLTDKKQTIFPFYYDNELKRRAIRLYRLRDRMTHIQKLRCNSDYAENYILKSLQQSKSNPQVIALKMKQLEELRAELRPMNESNFRLLFEEVQRMIVLIGTDPNNGRMRQRILSVQNQIMKEYMYDDLGQRKWVKPNVLRPLARSRTSSGNLHTGKISADQFLQESYHQIITRAISTKIRKKSQTYDKDQVFRDGMKYLSAIMPYYGSQLLDLTNFKVYLLPKLIRKVEQTLLLIPYSEQPLNLQLTKLLQNLRFLPRLILPEINQERIDQIFFPKVNPSLFSLLRTKLSDHHGNVCQALRELESKQNMIEDQIKSFAEERQLFLKVFLQNVDKLQELTFKVDQMYVGKEKYDVGEEGTNKIVLTLLLAEKQIKAQMLSLEDIQKRSQSPRGLQLIKEKVLPLFLNNLSQYFLCLKPSSSLQGLLELCQKTNKAIIGSDKSIDVAISMLQDIRQGKNERRYENVVAQLFEDLARYKVLMKQVINDSGRYLNLRADSVKHQLVRVDEFLQICEKGTSISCELIDERATRFLNTLSGFGI